MQYLLSSCPNPLSDLAVYLLFVALTPFGYYALVGGGLAAVEKPLAAAAFCDTDCLKRVNEGLPLVDEWRPQW